MFKRDSLVVFEPYLGDGDKLVIYAILLHLYTDEVLDPA